jgi:hypothetical protein
MRESTVEKYLHDQVTRAGGTTRKFKSPGRANVPDRIVIWPTGRVHFVELKAPGEGLRPGQEREVDRLADAGAFVFVFDAKRMIDDYVRANKK